MRKRIMLASLMLAFLTLTTLMPVVKATVYSWDGIQFVEGIYIKYPHPDRDYYGISPYSEWSKEGNNLTHHQFDHDKSLAIVVSLTVIGAAMGAVIGAQIGGVYGAVIGTVTGAILGAVLTWVAYAVFLDEYDCIWWWISTSFEDWLTENAIWLGGMCITNPAQAETEILTKFFTYGYLRAGSVTFYDGIGIGTPAPPPRLTVLAEDQYGNSLTTGYVYIDEENSESIYPSDDSYVCQDDPDSVYDSKIPDHLCVYLWKGYHGITWLKFTIPSGYQVTKAEVRLYQNEWSYFGNPVVSIHYSTDNSWSEETITWNNQPTFGGALDSKVVSNPYHWFSWDVSSTVSSSGTFSFCLKTETTDSCACFWSKDYDELDPYLYIEYSQLRYRGRTGSTFTVQAGTRKVFVSDFWESGNTGYRYGFQYWVEDGSTDNPKTITVVEDTTTKAHFYKKWCPGDINGDGEVNYIDVLLFREAYIYEYDSRADFNVDGKVDYLDVQVLSENYGNVYP